MTLKGFVRFFLLKQKELQGHYFSFGQKLKKTFPFM